MGGRLQNGRGGGAVKFHPYEKGGGGGTSFSHAEGGTQKFRGSFYVVLEFLGILKGWAAKCFHSLKRGGEKSFALS